MSSIDTPKGIIYTSNGGVLFNIKLRRNPYDLDILECKYRVETYIVTLFHGDYLKR